MILPRPLRLLLGALPFLGRKDPTDGHRIGFREALDIADLATDEGPPPEILVRVREAGETDPDHKAWLVDEPSDRGA